jgi:hypothetical protein
MQQQQQLNVVIYVKYTLRWFCKHSMPYSFQCLLHLLVSRQFPLQA